MFVQDGSLYLIVTKYKLTVCSAHFILQKAVQGAWIQQNPNCAVCVCCKGGLRVYYGLDLFLNKLSNALVSRKFCERHSMLDSIKHIFTRTHFLTLKIVSFLLDLFCTNFEVKLGQKTIVFSKNHVQRNMTKILFLEAIFDQLLTDTEL